MMLNKKIVLLAFAACLLLYISCNNDSSGIPATVTYTEQVAAILNDNCNICHRPGGSAHFSLATYEDARKNAAAIEYVTKEHIMPPWPADPHYSEFVGQRLLTDREIKILGKWGEGPLEGPADKLPPTPHYPVGSQIGTPDMRIAVQPTFLKGNSLDKFLLIKVPFELPADTFASLIEFVPGNHNVVHHVNGDMVRYEYNKKKDVLAGERIVNMVEDTASLLQAYQKLGLPNDDGSYPLLQKSVVNYLPGAFGQLYPPGIGGYKLSRKGAFLLNDLHYGFTSKDDITDSSYINIFFAKTPPDRPLMEFQIGTLGVSPVEPDLVIQPNTVKNVWSKFVVPIDISILTVNPHMHLLGKTFKAYAIRPEGDTIRLISIPKWDFNWQYFYTFKKMVKVPKGSTIVAEGVYDNTRQNLNNPFSPPQLVRDREGSMKATDEMFQFIISYLPYRAGDENISLEPKR
jgi:mono/diheme cytochrome c family protein